MYLKSTDGRHAVVDRHRINADGSHRSVFGDPSGRVRVNSYLSMFITAKAAELTWEMEAATFDAQVSTFLRVSVVPTRRHQQHAPVVERAVRRFPFR